MNEKTNNSSFSNINKRFKTIEFLNNNNKTQVNSIRLRIRENNNNNKSKGKNTKTNISQKPEKNIIIKNESIINNLSKNNTKKNKPININSYNYRQNRKFRFSCTLTKRNTPNISKEKKEFNKIFLVEPPKIKSTHKEKKQSNSNTNHIEIKKNRPVKKFSFIKKRNDTLSLVKTTYNTIEKENKNINIDTDKTISTKFIKAQEKWKKNYFATVIQKIFRGYLFRNITLRKNVLKSNLNVYVKKMPKDRSLCKHNNKIKNRTTLFNIKNDNRLTHFYTDTFTEKIKDDLKSLSNNKTIKRYNSPKRDLKIKEIIIKKKKNYPIVNLNLNNYFYPKYFYDYNNYCYDLNNTLSIKYNYNKEKYWLKIKLYNKLREMIKHWMEISFKNKIIQSILKTRKTNMNNDNAKDIKSDDTYNTTYSLIEEKKINYFGNNFIEKIKK